MKEIMSRLEERVRASDINLYDFALMTDEGIFELRTQPCNACNDSYSVAKAFVATAIGMLRDRGRIDLDERVMDVLGGEALHPVDERWRDVTVRHALSHTMGIKRGYLDIDVEDIWSYGTDDFLEVVFREPLPFEPGTHEQYSDAAYYLAARVFEARAGEAADAFLMRELFRPMRVQEAAWSRCPRNHLIGASGLYIRARDMVKLGWLYADGGMYEGRRLLSKDWIETEKAGGLAFRSCGDGDLLGKGGMYGQMLMFSAERRFAAAWHSFGKGSAELTRFVDRVMAEGQA